MTLTMWIFWLCIALLVWTYMLYPIAVWLIARFRPRLWVKAPFLGKVSMIVAAHNEESVIRQKVENCMKLDFGPADWEVILVSDGSTDDTECILTELAKSSDRLNVITYQPRAGKAKALNIGLSQANGEALIFSDANVILEKEAPREILSHLIDPKVGAVCGHVLVRPKGKKEIAGESLYMQFESWIQMAEAKLWSMVGIDGAFFALRRDLFRPLNKDIILDDHSLAMEALLAGQRIVYADKARGVEEVLPLASNEFRRKSRTVAGGFQYLASLLKRRCHLGKSVWFMFISHKLLRWVAPLLLIVALLANIILIEQPLYSWLLVGHSIFYLLALTGNLVPFLRRLYLFYIPYYFCVVNVAALLGMIRFFFGRQAALWEKVQR